jgi:hypothetical protein
MDDLLLIAAAALQRGLSPVFLTGFRPVPARLGLIGSARGLSATFAPFGDDLAIRAYRAGKLPFPDGAIIARIAWSYDASAENNKVFDHPQSFVAGSPKNGVRFMVKDSNKYAATGGWGYGQFDDGKSADASMLKACFPCHQALKDRDFVFTHYALDTGGGAVESAARSRPAAAVPRQSCRREAEKEPETESSL